MTKPIPFPAPRDCVAYLDKPGAILSCGVVGCAYMHFFEGPDREKEIARATSALFAHRIAYHGIRNGTKIPEVKIETA